jgi:hypothetical protein
MMEVFEEVLPVARQLVLLEVRQREREGVVDADEGGDVPVEFFAELFSETTASPIPAWAGRRLNLFRRAGAPGHEHADALTT